MAFDPDVDIPDLSGRVILITGGTNGLGRLALLRLAKHNPAHIYFTGRNRKSVDEVLSAVRSISSKVQVTFLECDLGARETIKAAVQLFSSDRLDVFIASAGIMAVPPGLTRDGHEVQFGTNHMGHAALLKLLLPVMLRTAERPGSDVRIVTLSSQGYGLHPAKGIAFDTLHTEQEGLSSLLGASWARYGQSKLANLLYTRELAHRYPSITSVVIHPGVVNTDLVKSLPFLHRMLVVLPNAGRMIPKEHGADNVLWAATTKKENLKSGDYYVPVGDSKGGRRVRLYHDDGTIAAKLWDWTEGELKDFGV